MAVMAEPFSRLVPGGRDRATQGIQATARRNSSTACRTLPAFQLSVRKATCPATFGKSANFRCWSRNRNSCSPSPGVSMATQAAHKLVTSHLRLVAKIAMGYRGLRPAAVGTDFRRQCGMMQAVKRFDPDRGFRLATYAMWWIRAAIQEYILHSWSLVKMRTRRRRRSCSSTCAS